MNIPQGGKRPVRGVKTETSKRVVWICLWNGVAWVWCSYLLAWCGRAEIAESLSKVAITEIIAVVVAYCVKALFENLSKNNAWPDKQRLAENTAEKITYDTAEENNDL